MTNKFFNFTKNPSSEIKDLVKKYIKVGDLVNLASNEFPDYYIKVEVVTITSDKSQFTGKLVNENLAVFPDLKIGDHVEFHDFEIGQYLNKDDHPEYKKHEEEAYLKKEAEKNKSIVMGPIKDFDYFYDYSGYPRISIDETKKITVGDTVYMGHEEYEDLWLEAKVVFVSDDKKTLRGMITHTDPNIFKGLKIGDQVNFHDYEIANYSSKN